MKRLSITNLKNLREHGIVLKVMRIHGVQLIIQKNKLPITTFNLLDTNKYT